MTKNTNKNNTDRLCVTFKHPEILQEFNNYFYNKYNTVKGYRLEVLEDLISNFNKTQTITANKPEYYQENTALKEENNQLKEDIQHLKDQQKTATTKQATYTNKINNMTKEIEDLKQQLQQYTHIKEDNIRLEETIEKNTLTIDHLTKNNQEVTTRLNNTEKQNKELTEDYKTLVKEHQNTIKQLTNKHETTLKQVTNEHDKIIKDLQDKITSKDNKYNHIEERNNKLQDDYNDLQKTINKVSYAIGSLNSMSLLDRILKKYPEEIKELKP